MSAMKKKPTKKRGPGRGGKRAGAGRPPVPGSKTAVLSIRVTDETKAKIITAAGTRGMTPGELISEWSALLWVP